MKQSDIQIKIIQGLSKIGMVLKADAWECAGSRHITPTQRQILTVLRLFEPASLSLNDVAGHLGVTAATASDATESLAQKGFLLKHPAEEDARRLNIRLTALGRKEAARSMDWPDFMMKAVGELSQAEQQAFYSAMLKMIRSLQTQNKISLARMCFGCKYFRQNEHPGARRPHHCAFVDAPLADAELRIECPDFVEAR